MKQLTFIRHAKSDWGDELLKDVDRPLSERGYTDAYSQSKWLATKGGKPDLIISSTATRAISTALIFARAFDLDMHHFTIEKNIYECTEQTLLSIIRTQGGHKKHVMLFGHNPAFTNICNTLSDDLFFDNVPTCGIVSFQFELSNWESLSPKTGKIDFHQFPKEFKNRD